MIEEKTPTEFQRTTRVIDLKIPLPYLLTAVCGIGWALISMWFALGQLVKSVDELQATVKAGNASMSLLANEISLIKFRINTNEDKLKSHDDMLRRHEDTIQTIKSRK